LAVNNIAFKLGRFLPDSIWQRKSGAIAAFSDSFSHVQNIFVWAIF